jgi:hypothetical protein
MPFNYFPPKRSSSLLRLRGGADNDTDEISQSSNDLLTLNSLEFHTMKIRALNTQSIQHPINMIMRRNGIINYITTEHIDVTSLSEVSYPTHQQLLSWFHSVQV